MDRYTDLRLTRIFCFFAIFWKLYSAVFVHMLDVVNLACLLVLNLNRNTDILGHVLDIHHAKAQASG